MNQARLRQRIDDFRQAVFRLKEACEQPENAFIRDSVIQRFEFSYELGWKMLKLKLQEQGIEAQGPKSVLEQALAIGLIEDGNLWSELHHMRNLTSHTYDEALARKVYEFIRQEGLDLLQALSEETQQWM